ncbi:MmgE/PrpD family protein [Bordetella sp. BOR01]|uniref:MmgE/PrpD family protein n=1 Tax=Bordetella sp. BOR01 TaxID=2854779 RepID=UPI001C481370|nr:MmgE/PrpD family protein [Bordetella sp. BOR01]MBV7483368.1 MmgE/PrpD family protein [Bordetella sp. BOR01]
MKPSMIDPAAGLTALADFAAGTSEDALPPRVLRQAQACVLYGLSVGIAAVCAQAPRAAAAALDWEYEGSSGGATRLLDGRRLPAGAAAFANGVLMHSRVQEDAHPAGHVGVVVVPAALAVAEQVAASGPRLLCSVVSGYETALRIGRDHAADASERGFRTTSIYGGFGAAAAAARLMQLPADRTRDALAMAASVACGLREFVNAGSEEYPLHAGYAARNGISAAACARAGTGAAATSLEGDAGFFRSYGQADGSYARRLAEGLGDEFEFLQVTYKPYPTCQFHRSVVGSVLTLRRRVPLARLRRMAIHMHPFEADFVGVRYVGPFHQFSQTFMSAPFCAALAWVHGQVGYRGMHRYDDVRVLGLIPLIEVVSDPAIARYQPKIVAVDDAGVTWEQKETSGSDAYQMTWETAQQMSGVLCEEAGVPRPLAQALFEAVDGLGQAASISTLVTAAASAVGQARRH